VIRCEGLVFEYADGTRALDGLDLSIAGGERVSITGRNGSGKSTLVRHWNGLLRPTAGRVLVDGATTEGRRVAELARIVGLTFQDPDRQLFERTCAREVAFGARNVGLRGQELDAAVDSALDAVGLVDRSGANPYDLGPSKRRLLALASVLAMHTPVVVLDEPTMGLDQGEIDRVIGAVTELAAGGRTVVAISHDARFVARAFDRVIRLDAGRIVADGPRTPSVA
jgi:energy-coupling factor transport system ATP-binding protein